jgi:type I restriction enzyme M protein
MIDVQEKPLRESTSRWIAELDMALTSVLSTGESNTLIREVFASLLLLRWADLQDAEQEAMAIFEDRSYQPLLPEWLQWRHWARLDSPNAIADRVGELVCHLDGLRGDVAHPLAAHLHALAAPLRRVLNVNCVPLSDIATWVGELPFETPSERRALLEVLDQVLTETASSHDGQYSTPAAIARLAAAVANPQPGERVYDPCFGAGNFLVAAWQSAERSSQE